MGRASRDVAESRRIRRRGWPGTFVRGRSSHPILRNFPSFLVLRNEVTDARATETTGSAEAFWRGFAWRRALVGGREEGEQRRRLELARRYGDKGVE